MATYAMNINEQTNQGKALLAYLGTLNVQLRQIEVVDPLPCRFSKDEMKDLLAQSTREARSGKGTPHGNLKSEVASWL